MKIRFRPGQSPRPKRAIVQPWVLGCLIAFNGCLTAPLLAQTAETNRLTASVPAPYFYVKPVLGGVRSVSTFEAPGRFDQLHKKRLLAKSFGLLLGYHRNRLEFETGVVTLPVITGYRFLSQPDNGLDGLNSQYQRTVFIQIPVQARYTLWQPTSGFSIGARGGVGLNVTSRNNRYLNGYLFDITTFAPDGTQQLTRSTVRTDHKLAFLTGMVGIDVQCRLTPELSAIGSIDKLFSPKALATMNAQVAPSNESQTYVVHTQGSTNSYRLQLGLQYRFTFRKTRG